MQIFKIHKTKSSILHISHKWKLVPFGNNLKDNIEDTPVEICFPYFFILIGLCKLIKREWLDSTLTGHTQASTYTQKDTLEWIECFLNHIVWQMANDITKNIEKQRTKCQKQKGKYAKWRQISHNSIVVLQSL